MAGRKQSQWLVEFLLAVAAIAALLVLWQVGVTVFSPPAFLVPAPREVGKALVGNAAYLAGHSATTLAEMLLGLAAGSIAGAMLALAMAHWQLARRLILPAIVTTQTLPVFAIAPLVVIWFGFGMPSKVFMAALITFFPVASAFHDGLSSTRREWLDLARGWAAGDLATLLRIRVPAALPSLATGLKVAATLAPIGAIVGEWAGASAGLGYVMLQANARLQTDMVFASLVLLAAMAWLLRAAVAFTADRLIFWKDS